MATSFASYFVKIFGDASGFYQTVDAMKTKAGEIGKAGQDAARQGRIGDLGAGHLRVTLTKAQEAAGGLMERLLQLTGIDMGAILRLGTIAGAVAGIGTLTKRYMDMEDELRNVGNRFKVLGLDVESNTKRLWEWSRQAQDSFGIAAGEARKLALSAMTKGLDPTRFREMAGAAIGLGAALGVAPQMAERLVEQMEAGNYMILRRYNPSIRQLLDQGAGRAAIEAHVNNLIAQGTLLAQERSKSFGGQLDRLQNSFRDLANSAARAIGPAFAPLVMRMADAVQNLNRKLEDWITNNREAVTQTVKVITQVLAGALAMRYFGSGIGLAGAAMRHLIPGFGLLSGGLAALAGGGATALRALSLAFTGLFASGTTLTGLFAPLAAAFAALRPTALKASMASLGGAIRAGLGGALGAINSLMGVAAAAFMTFLNPLTYVRIGIGLLRLSFVGLGMAMKLAGIGLIIGMVAALSGITDTFGESGAAAKGLGEIFKDVFKSIGEFMKPVFAWLKTEGMIIIRALAASFRQLVPVFEAVWTFLKNTANAALQWLNSMFGTTLKDIGDLWAEFTAELAVLGLRIQQVGLMIAIGFAAIPEVIRWIGNAFMAFAQWFANDWVNILKNALMTYWEYLKLIGTAVMDIGRGIMDALSGKGFSFDFSATEEQFKALRNQAAKTLTGLEIPGMDLSNVAPALQEQLKGVTSQISDAKKMARESQARERTDAQNASGKTGKTGDDTKGQVRIGGRDRASFSDPAAFWKKLQETAAGQRMEQYARDQLTTQQEIARIVQAMYQDNQVSRQGGTAQLGIVPR